MHCRIRGRHDTFTTRQGLRSSPQHHQGHMERRNGVFEWSSTFNSPLEMNKLALVNFAQSATKSSDASDLTLSQRTQVTIRVHYIKASPNAKLLGVILDSKLNWNAQHEKVREKAVKWTDGS